MTQSFLIVVAILLGFVAAIWSGKGWVNILIKVIYTVAAVLTSGLAVQSFS